MSLRIPLLVFALAASLEASVIGTSFTVTYSEFPNMFTLTVVDTLGVDQDESWFISRGTLWHIEFQIDEDANASVLLGDYFKITSPPGVIRPPGVPNGFGWAYHNVGIHTGEVANPNEFTFQFGVFARGPAGPKSLPDVQPHPPNHSDRFKATLNWTTNAWGDITSYNLLVTGDHVPEPGTVWLLSGGGVALLGILAQRRRRSRPV